jgi:hypothetical protein
MQPGHPFDTPDLDDARARQRRWLRAVPDWIITHAELPRLDVPVADRNMVEGLLRAEIDASSRDSVEWLEHEKSATAAAALLRALGTVRPAGIASPFDHHVDAFLDEVAERAEARTRRVEDPILLARLYRLVLLAGWADLLAGGWQDHRLRWQS